MSDSVTVQVVLFEKPEPTDWIHVDDLKPGAIIKDGCGDYWYYHVGDQSTEMGWYYLTNYGCGLGATPVDPRLLRKALPVTLVRDGR